MLCKNCLNIIEVKYGSGLFCSEKCARSFSSKEKRQEINKKVSETLKNKYKNDEKYRNLLISLRARRTDSTNKKQGDSLRKYYANLILTQEFEKLSWIQKRIRLFKEQNNTCAICGQGVVWNNKPLVLQFDHIDGNHKNWTRENIRLVCPNCHTQTDTWGRQKSSLSR